MSSDVQVEESDVVIEESEEEESSSDESTTETESENIDDPDIDPSSDDENEDVDDSQSSDEDIVLIGDEDLNAQEKRNAAPEWVRKLRKSHRELQSENRELAKKVASLEQPQSQVTSLGAKPNLEDFEYDTTKYEEQLAGWYEKKQHLDRVTAQKNVVAQQQQQEWQNKLNNYQTAKTTLRVKDFEDAEAVVVDLLDQTKQGIIVQGAENPALLIYALGKNQNLARELSDIDDPIKFAFEVAKLEKTLKVKKRKAPPPERAVKSSGTKTSSMDSGLEKLRAEADRTGDQTKVLRYKAKLARIKK